MDLSKIRSVDFTKVDTKFKEFTDCRNYITANCNSTLLLQEFIKTLSNGMDTREAEIFSNFMLKTFLSENDESTITVNIFLKTWFLIKYDCRHLLIQCKNYKHFESVDYLYGTSILHSFLSHFFPAFNVCFTL